jgi:hypothetical protein
MSDHLTRLAARALGRGDAVQPRLPSLFEAASPALDAHVASEAPPEDPGTLRAARPWTAERPVPRWPGIDDRSAQPGDRRATPPGDHRAAPAGDALPSGDAAPPSGTAAASGRDRDASRARDARGGAAPEDGRPSERTDERRSPADPPPDPAQPVAPPRNRPDASPEARGAAPERSLRPAVVVERPARENAPSVRITIGRVEVRAAAAPPPRPAPARPRGPRLSLDEYVRLRDEGRR